MAVFPQGLSNIDARCNPGERRVLQQLKRCLEDDYLVWHDVPIGPRARQPDFVILSPRWGVLLLEVKDWKRSTLGPATRDRVELRLAQGHKVVPHPLRQVRDVTLELVDLFSADPALVHSSGTFAGKLVFPYGWGVVMSGLKRSELGTDFDAVFAPERTLLRDDLDEAIEPMAFQRRLWGLFTLHFPHTLTLPQRDRIRWHLFPEVRLPVQGALAFDDDKAEAAPLPDLLQVMDLQQEQIARTLGEGHRVIHGVAGSGKTMILVFRAQFLAVSARPGRPILVMCFNRALATRLQAMLRERGVDERVQVSTFHAWCADMVRSYQLQVAGVKGVPPPRPGSDDWFAALAHTVEQAVERGRVPAGQYHALLIDEAHDFEDAWLRMAARMVAPETHSLLVLYDDAQRIYSRQTAADSAAESAAASGRTKARAPRRLNFASLGIEARGRTSILKLNYRNTTEVLGLAVACAQHLLQGAEEPGAGDDDAVPQVEPASAGRRGPLPLLLRSPHAQAEAVALVQQVQAALAEGVLPAQMALLAPTRAQLAPIAAALRREGLALQSQHDEGFRRFDWHTPSLKLMTLHAAKGLEFPWVAVAGLHSLPLKGHSEDEALRLLYVAMTRSTQRLVLSGVGSTPLVERVATALAGLAQRLARQAP